MDLSVLAPIIKDIQDLLDEVKNGIIATSDKFHKLISLKDISAFMENIVQKANDYKPQVAKYDGYR